jgi:methanogenic corrinoid protein MtbC1
VSAAPQLQQWLALLAFHDLGGLRSQLAQALVRLGLSAFVTEVVAPFNTLVGDAWMRGELDVYQEHSYTETVQRVLRGGIHGLGEVPSAAGPRMLFSTLPGEPHGIGLLMAEAISAAEGANCHSLGVQTPVGELVLAAASYRADIVALSFTPCLGAKQVHGALDDLRAALPTAVGLWVGGSAPALRRHAATGVAVMPLLQDIGGALRDWRALRGLHPD